MPNQSLREQTMFLLMLRCGLRVGEVCRLNHSDIFWGNKQIIIHNSKGKVDRIVYFSEDVEKALNSSIEETKNQESYVFKSRERHRETLTLWTVAHIMKKLIIECELDGHGYTPHTLRHTFATTMLNAGISLIVLKELMGA